MRITQFVIYLLFFLSLVVLGTLSFVFLKRYSSYVRYSADVERTYKLINEITTMESLLKDTETSNRGYLLTQDSAFLQPLFKSEEDIKSSILILANLTTDNQNQQKRISYLNMLVQDMKKAMEHTRLMFVFNKNVYRKNLQISKQKMDECRQVFNEMKEEEFALLAVRNKNKYLYEATTPEVLTGLFSFSAITFTVSCVVIIREFRGRKKYQKELEMRLNELRQSNAELEQITFIASHDLQEPLRKINTFTDRLMLKHAPFLDEEGQSVINRISYSSNRMRGLVEDLATYTSLVQVSEKKQSVNLKEILTDIAQLNLELIQSKNAQVLWDNLPLIEGYPNQIELLFKALIDNSIKFSQPDLSPRIHIYGNPCNAQEVAVFNVHPTSQKFIKITLRDNGIGFDNEFAEKMFRIFQRLHTQYSEYEGKGIGLAIVKRVMTNHNGFVFARGFPMTGAEFILFFPVT
jgi:signal transduction histidine kinase